MKPIHRFVHQQTPNLGIVSKSEAATAVEELLLKKKKIWSRLKEITQQAYESEQTFDAFSEQISILYRASSSHFKLNAKSSRQNERHSGKCRKESAYIKKTHKKENVNAHLKQAITQIFFNLLIKATKAAKHNESHYWISLTHTCGYFLMRGDKHRHFLQEVVITVTKTAKLWCCEH